MCCMGWYVSEVTVAKCTRHRGEMHTSSWQTTHVIVACAVLQKRWLQWREPAREDDEEIADAGDTSYNW